MRCAGSGLCRECKGEGQVVCAPCGGLGRVLRRSAVARPVASVGADEGSLVEGRCGRCAGRGSLPCDKHCESCRGSGHLSPRVDPAFGEGTNTEEADSAAGGALGTGRTEERAGDPGYDRARRQGGEPDGSSHSLPVLADGSLPQGGSLPVTWLVVLAALAVHVVLGWVYGWEAALLTPIQACDDMGAMVPSLFYKGELWRWFTASLLHRSLPQLFLALAALLYCGYKLERRLGSRRFFVVFALGNLMAVQMAAVMPPPSLIRLGGMLGGVCALLGYALITSYLHQSPASDALEDPGQTSREAFAPGAAWSADELSEFMACLVGLMIYGLVSRSSTVAVSQGMLIGVLLGVLARPGSDAEPSWVLRFRGVGRLEGLLAWSLALALVVSFAGVARHQWSRKAMEQGTRYLEAGQPDQARRCFETAMRWSPLRREARTQRVLALLRQGQDGPALYALASLLQQQPRDDWALLTRAEVYFQHGLQGPALRDLGVFADEHRVERAELLEEAQYHRIRARYLASEGHWKEAGVEADAALATVGWNNEQTLAFAVLAYCVHRGAGEDAQALDLLRKTSGQGKDLKAWELALLSSLQRSLEQPATSRSAFGELSPRPTSPEVPSQSSPTLAASSPRSPASGQDVSQPGLDELLALCNGFSGYPTEAAFYAARVRAAEGHERRFWWLLPRLHLWQACAKARLP